MSIKHKIKIRKVTGIGVHGLATGDSLDLSDNAKASDELPASDGESARRSVPAAIGMYLKIKQSAMITKAVVRTKQC